MARRFAWELSGEVDLDAMRAAARRLVGRHDFGGFGRSPRPGGSTVRTVHQVTVRRAASLCGGDRLPLVMIEVTADAFLYGMMRAFAGALVAVGAGSLSPEALAGFLAHPATRAVGVTVAPARGLHQWAVDYASAPGGTP